MKIPQRHLRELQCFIVWYPCTLVSLFVCPGSMINTLSLYWRNRCGLLIPSGLNGGLIFSLRSLVLFRNTLPFHLRIHADVTQSLGRSCVADQMPGTLSITSCAFLRDTVFTDLGFCFLDRDHGVLLQRGFYPRVSRLSDVITKWLSSDTPGAQRRPKW